MQFFQNTKIDFIGKRKIFLSFSMVMLIVSAVALVRNRGPELGIDFTGGTLLQLSFDELPDIDLVRGALNDAGFSGFALQSQPADASVIIRVKTGELSKEDITVRLIDGLRGTFEGNLHERPERVEYVGPVVGRKLIRNALAAIFGALAVMILYIAFRFKSWVWGLAGVLALAHDVFITIGFLTLLRVEITLVVVAALLTLAGYSINDTIVVFDRVRENLRTARRETFFDLYNRSINETLSRTVVTSVTTILAAFALFFLGGEVIHSFAQTLWFGILIGTYSTLGVGIPMVYQLQYGDKSK